MQRARRARLHRPGRPRTNLGQVHDNRRPHQRPTRRLTRRLVLQVRHTTAVLQQRPALDPRHRALRPPRHPPQRGGRGEHHDGNRGGEVRKRRRQSTRHADHRRDVRRGRARGRRRHQVQDARADAQRGSRESAACVRWVCRVHRNLRLFGSAPGARAYGR